MMQGHQYEHILLFHAYSLKILGKPVRGHFRICLYMNEFQIIVLLGPLTFLVFSWTLFFGLFFGL